MILFITNGVPRIAIDNATNCLSATRPDGRMVHCLPCVGTQNTYLLARGDDPLIHEVGKAHALTEFIGLLGVDDKDGNVYSQISERWV